VFNGICNKSRIFKFTHVKNDHDSQIAFIRIMFYVLTRVEVLTAINPLTSKLLRSVVIRDHRFWI